MIRCDALIVGGGPAGLAAAIALRQKNLDVLVADALHPPIDKACGEGLMPDSQAALGKLGLSIDASDGHPFEGIAFFSPRSRAIAPFSGRPGIGIRRLHLHTLLVERCHQLGVRLEWGSGVALDPARPVRLRGEDCRYRYLIGADGQSSRVRRWGGLERGNLSSKRFGQRRHFRVAPWSRMVEVHWGDFGQAYVTPVAQDEVCVATVSRSSSGGMDAVLAGLPLLRRQLQGAIPVNAVRGAVTTTRKLRRVTSGNVALLGDASGSADAVTGEGIALSFRQAVLLADAIGAADLRIYQAGHPAILRLPQMMSKVLLSLDRWPSLRDRAVAVFAHEPQIFRHMLAMHMAEESVGRFLLHSGTQLSWRLLTIPAAL